MDLNAKTTSSMPNTEEVSKYKEALRLFRQGHHLYTQTGRPEISGWRYDNALYCFHRAVVALRNQVETPQEQTLLRNAQYFLYKSYYGRTARGRHLGKKLDIVNVEAALTQSPVRRHRVAVWIVEHFSPAEPLGIRLLDLYDRLRPAL